MGKNIKSYATTQVHSPRKGREALMAKVPNLSFTIWYGLTVHIIRFSNYKQNFQKLSSPVKFAHFVNLFYIMFQAPASTENAQQFQRIMQIPRNSPTYSANYAKLAPFANTTPYVSDA